MKMIEIGKEMLRLANINVQKTTYIIHHPSIGLRRYDTSIISKWRIASPPRHVGGKEMMDILGCALKRGRDGEVFRCYFRCIVRGYLRLKRSRGTAGKLISVNGFRESYYYLIVRS